MADDHASAEVGVLLLKTAKGAGWVIAWRVATRNLGLLSTLVLARLLTPGDFGLVAIATGFIAAVDALSTFSVQTALIREEAALDRDLYDTAFTISLARGLITAGLVAAAAQPLAAFFAEPRLTAIILALAVGTLLSAFENIGIVDFRRTMAFHLEFRLQLASRIAAVAVTIAVAAALRTYWALVAGLLAGQMARLILTYTMSPYRPRLGLRCWRPILGFSVWTWAAGLALMLQDRLEPIVVGRLLGPASVGIFAIGTELGALPITEIVLPLCRALFSGFAEANRTGLSPARLYIRVVSLALLLTVPAGVGISLIAGPLIRLTLGPQWLDAAPVVWIVAIAAAVWVLSSVSSELLNADGRPQLNFHLSAIGTAAKIPLLVGLVAAFGIIGGAVAVAASMAVVQLLYLDTTRRRIGVPLGELAREIWRPFFAAAVMAVVLFACGWGWTPGGGDAAVATRVVVVASLSGAAIYVIAVAGAWLAAGRPDGAEADAVRLVRYALRRLPAPFGLARSAAGS